MSTHTTTFSLMGLAALVLGAMSLLAPTASAESKAGGKMACCADKKCCTETTCCKDDKCCGEKAKCCKDGKKNADKPADKAADKK